MSGQACSSRISLPSSPTPAKLQAAELLSYGCSLQAPAPPSFFSSSPSSANPLPLPWPSSPMAAPNPATSISPSSGRRIASMDDPWPSSSIKDDHLYVLLAGNFLRQGRAKELLFPFSSPTRSMDDLLYSGKILFQRDPWPATKHTSPPSLKQSQPARQRSCVFRRDQRPTSLRRCSTRFELERSGHEREQRTKAAFAAIGTKHGHPLHRPCGWRCNRSRGVPRDMTWS